MSEEEIICRIKRIIDLSYTKNFATFELMYQDVDAIKGLLDLYNKEKEKNKELEDKINKVLDKLENEPYVAYTFYGDILHESDEIINILKGE